jgi:hypothetical protein
MAWQRLALWGAWALSFLLALACIAVFIQGVVRDNRVGSPVIRVDFSSARGWGEASFRVWGQQTYDLLISSVNHDASLVGRQLGAEFAIEITDPDGRLVLQRTFLSGATGHRVPSNYGDVRLATLELDGSPVRTWSLRVRVLKPDSAFPPEQTHLKLYKRQYDPGMGGLMNYAIMVPGALLLSLALVLSVPLWRGGSRWPLLLTALAAVLVLVAPHLLTI